MASSKLFVDCGLLKTNVHFRRLLVARTISLLGLGLLAVAVPIQIYGMTGSSALVGLAVALDGAGMFIGLLLGGVLADRHDRKRLILIARSVCGLGFVALAVNSLLPAPSLAAVYALSFWDGFFGALGVNALMAAMPHIVGRANLMQARALGMLTMRFATIVSPAAAGLVIAAGGVGWAYVGAAAGTGLTVLTLLGLPRMVPENVEIKHPLRMMADAFGFLFGHRVILGVVGLGSLMTLTTAIRVLFPALALEVYGGGAFEIGLMYAAVPVGATAGAAISGWATRLDRPGAAMSAVCMAAFACVTLLGATGSLWVALAALVGFGYAMAIASLLQYSMVQGHTPDHFLGRVNSLWTAQDVFGDSVGSIGLGLLATLLSPAWGILLFGLSAMALCGVLSGTCAAMRRAPLTDPALADPALAGAPGGG